MRKLFLISQRAADYLRIGDGRLRSIAPYALHIYLPSLQSRLWAEAYIVAYREHLQATGQQPRISSAKEFAATSEAASLVESVVAAFNARLGARSEFTATQVAELFSVALPTVAGWRTAGALVGSPHAAGSREYFTYTQDELRRFIEWRGAV